MRRPATAPSCASVRPATVVWRIETNTAITGAVGSDGFVVAVGSPRGDVIAFGADGKELWRAQVGAAIQSPPLVGRGLVIVRGSDYRVSAFDASQRPAPLELPAHRAAADAERTE